MVPDGHFYLVCNAGHSVQEDAGEELANRVTTFPRDEAKITGAQALGS